MARRGGGAPPSSSTDTAANYPKKARMAKDDHVTRLMKGATSWNAWRRENRNIVPDLKGELLHPEQEPAHVLAELKREMGPIAFSAQYQQSPIPPGGTIIKRKWLVPYDKIRPQAGDRIIISWDIALSEAETGDYSACVVLLRRQEVFYILEVVRGRFPFDALKRK